MIQFIINHPNIINIKIKQILLFIFLLINISFSQSMRETRAVWVSTNYKLDWPPPTFNQDLQKKELIKIFDNIERLNLNTIFFQVRSNGTLLFRSKYELFSPYITGKIGEFGNYDPLKFAVEEAHKRGLEIHAWLNTFRIFSGNNSLIKNNMLHISKLHPEWILKNSDDSSIWLNPGIPEVHNYLINIIDELVANYNIDGVQLDFIRYPNGEFDDSDSFQKFGNTTTLDNWRRNNITTFISELYSSIKEIKSKVKLGVTPIGIYKSIYNGRGLEGYANVYQDSREWMQIGIIDYAAPQIYWDTRTNPKFEAVVKDWIENSYGKNIIIGIAAYKPEVSNELEREISITRKLKAAGVAFFRYGNIANKTIHSFAKKTLPSEISFQDSNIAKSNLTISVEYSNQKNRIRINENRRAGNGYYGLYEWENNYDNSSKHLLKVVPNYISEISFKLNNPNKVNYYYSVVEYDQLWNEVSEESGVRKISIPKLAALAKEIIPINNPVFLNNRSEKVLFCFSNKEEMISLSERLNGKRSRRIESAILKKGFNRISINTEIHKNSELIIYYQSSGKTVSIIVE